jgi:hypothetical protein
MVRSTYLRVVGSLVLCVGCGARSGLAESEGAGGASSTSSASSTSGSSSGGVPAVSVGSSHTCILTTGAGVPVGVTGLSSGARAVSAGGSHTCAVTFAGGVEEIRRRRLLPRQDRDVERWKEQRVALVAVGDYAPTTINTRSFPPRCPPSWRSCASSSRSTSQWPTSA